jgi:hypothetical protein
LGNCRGCRLVLRLGLRLVFWGSLGWPKRASHEAEREPAQWEGLQ